MVRTAGSSSTNSTRAARPAVVGPGKDGGTSPGRVLAVMPELSAVFIAIGLDSLGVNHLVPNGEPHQVGEGREVQFPHDRGAVGFSCFDADSQTFGYLLVALPFS
jgi:hypothetical protein